MKKFFLLLFAASCYCAALHGQVVPQKSGNDLKDVITRLQALSTDNVIEKAYLHFDKPYYNAGDTIYFKAYVTAGERHELSKVSGVLHVDLINKADTVMQTLILQLKNGLAWGDFALPGYLPKGSYRIRAYTRWMQNAGDTYFFYKTITVNGKSMGQAPIARTISNKPDVQFFPEGGTLVTAVPSRIAFKAVDGNGMGVTVKGSVVDNNNAEVAQFTSAHLGMGQIFLTPEEGKLYKAKITYPDGSVTTVDLPKPETNGISLSVNNSDPAKLSIDMNANKPYYLANKNKEIAVVIYSAGVVKTVKTVLDNQVIGFDLPKKDLRSGIMQITLFSDNGVPLGERLVFIQTNDGVNFTINSDKTSYASGNKAHIIVNARTAEDKASVGSFSVSVINENKVPANGDIESDILADMLLTSDLRGYVEQPGYYFNNVTNDTRNNLDILMLTQGYRRFQWKQFLTGTPTPIAYQPEVGMDIKGTLLTKAGAPVPNEKITLMLPVTGQTMSATTDAAGKFAFIDLGYTDKTRFLLNIDNKSLKNKARLMLDKTNISVPLNTGTLPEVNTDERLPQYTAMTGGQAPPDKTQELNAVNVNAKQNYRSSSLAGAGNADQVIFNKQIKSFASLSQALTGVARNVDFNNGKAYLRSSVSIAGGKIVSEPMMIVIDGAITSGTIDNIQPADVESVEILKGANAAVYGMNSGSGVMVINTRRGGEVAETSQEMAPGIVSITPQGFYMAREFYAPVYDDTKKDAAEGATVYWKPNLVTNADGNTAFDYFNQGPGRYRIVIEGIDNTGNIGRVVYKYTVQ
ncbi:TonB-dependent receptor plug domain-containing protein [Mucilaginibacter sp. AK015]|uniref:TonB-dependent receptor plug domain-containing protein n=1 Tax=Mucilaginibacter sp. AK015 TaxID=2723072 RepID=UPI00161590F2|nr:TonB-dependent receptor plug domain-containing protein [Mucilaginibacter sp. AK015]MBB5397781.1 TonB-dependent SusC/RagA subfamily outer membrane receptor [Mucilaginibacter sp. AK015]